MQVSASATDLALTPQRPHAMSQTVNIEALQLGMFIHLDLGWWAHPFALSSFLLTSADQIETIRGLGLRRLRWSPEKSRLAAPPPEPAAVTLPAPADPAAEPATELSAEPSAEPGTDSPAVTAAGDPATAAPAASATPAVHASQPEPTIAAGVQVQASPGRPEQRPVEPRAQAHGTPQDRDRAALAHQHAARHRCEQQYGEAGQAWQAAQDLVPQAPLLARETTEALTRALLDKMMVDDEMCVRVLGDVGVDRTAVHALNVAVISLLMGRVFGFADPEMLDLGVGALMHDVGKIDLPARLQNVDAQGKPAELLAYREHVALGLVHGARMGLSEGALTVLAQHHEMADGSGFPARLTQDRMVIGARIVALVNRYDKLCNPPQLALAITPHEALSMIFAQSRNKFDATMLNAFIRMMGVYPPGSLVQLTDDRYAAVVSCNSSRPLKPRVLVCDTRVPVDQALLLSLDGEVDLGIRRSLKPTQLPAAARDYLSPRQRMVYFFEPVPVVTAQSAEALAA